LEGHKGDAGGGFGGLLASDKGKVDSSTIEDKIEIPIGGPKRNKKLQTGSDGLKGEKSLFVTGDGIKASIQKKK